MNEKCRKCNIFIKSESDIGRQELEGSKFIMSGKTIFIDELVTYCKKCAEGKDG